MRSKNNLDLDCIILKQWAHLTAARISNRRDLLGGQLFL